MYQCPVLCHLNTVAPAINTETPTASDVTGEHSNFWLAVLIFLREQQFWSKFLQAWGCLRQRWETKKCLHDWNLTAVEVCRIRTPNLSKSTEDKDASVTLTKSWPNALKPKGRNTDYLDYFFHQNTTFQLGHLPPAAEMKKWCTGKTHLTPFTQKYFLLLQQHRGALLKVQNMPGPDATALPNSASTSISPQTGFTWRSHRYPGLPKLHRYHYNKV